MNTESQNSNSIIIYNSMMWIPHIHLQPLLWEDGAMNKGAMDYAIAATFVVVTMDTCKDQGTLKVNFDVLNAFLLYMMGDYAKTGKSLRSQN